MIHAARPLSFRHRLWSVLVPMLVWAGFRRWLSRPWQWSLRDYMITVALCAAALLLRGSPAPVILVVAGVAVAVHAVLGLARFGFKLVDIATLLVLILLTAAILLPAMEWTRTRTFGMRFFPHVVPARYMELFSDSP